MTESSHSQVSPPAGGTAAGLRHFAVAAVTMLGLMTLTYAHASLERFRPWIAGEALPVARMFMPGPEHKAKLPEFAEAGLSGKHHSQEALSEALGSAVASNLETDEAAPPPPTEPPPETSREVAAPAVRIEPEEYAGIEQGVESPEALARFFAKLEKSAGRTPGAITRVAHYGDSSVAADAITRTARRRLQTRFGDSGHGFILISRGDMHYGHHDIRHRSSDGWEMLSLVRDPLRRGLYGYGGVQAQATAGEYALFETSREGAVGKRASRFELLFRRHKRGLRVRVYVDGERRHEIDTRAAEPEDDAYAIEVPDGPHTFKIRTVGGGIGRLYGAILERSRPGVVYDSLGLVGARAERLLNADREHMAGQIAHRAPDLLVLGFGGNEAGNKWLQLERYEQDLRKVVKVMRAGSAGMDCLLFGPLDQAERDKRGRIVTIPVLPEIVDVQRRVAKAHGCAFFDAYRAMGGENSFRRWYKSRPQLATSDLRHATPKGYEVIGNLYYKALLKAFADYLAKR